MSETLHLISDLYDHVEKMREIVGKLREFDVEIRMGSRPDKDNPLGTQCVIMVILHPRAESLQ